MGQVYDVPINEVGKAQIEEKIEEIRELAPELIISSPLKRTAESAEIVSEALGLPIEFDDRLMEINMGSLSGETHANAASMMGMNLPDFLASYRSGAYDYGFQNGESAKEVTARVKGFLKDLKNRELEAVLLVCHGGILRMLYFVATGNLYPLEEGLPNAALVALDYE